MAGRTALPASVISPNFSNRRTRSLFSSVHGLFFFLGVNLCIRFPLISLYVLSIQPKQSASSTASDNKTCCLRQVCRVSAQPSIPSHCQHGAQAICEKLFDYQFAVYFSPSFLSNTMIADHLPQQRNVIARREFCNRRRKPIALFRQIKYSIETYRNEVLF